MKQLRAALLEVATQACEEKFTLTAVQLKQVLKLAMVGARSTQKTDPTIVDEVWQPDSWQALSSRLASSSRYKQSRGLREISGQIARLSKTGENAREKPLKKKESGSKAPKRKADDLLDSEAAKPARSTKTKRKKVASNAS
jgi:DNA polymerase phi